MVLPLRRTSEYRLKSAILIQWGQLDPKFQVEGVAPYQPFFFSENKAKSWSFVWYKNLDRSFFLFVTIHAFDRRADGRTDSFLVASPHWYSMQRGEDQGKTFHEITLPEKHNCKKINFLCINNIMRLTLVLPTPNKTGFTDLAADLL